MIGVTAIGLGTWGTLFSGAVKRTLGVCSSESVVRRTCGSRELWSGYSLAEDPTRTGVLWAPAAAYTFDIAALAALTGPKNPKPQQCSACARRSAGSSPMEMKRNGLGSVGLPRLVANIDGVCQAAASAALTISIAQCRSPKSKRPGRTKVSGASTCPMGNRQVSYSA